MKDNMFKVEFLVEDKKYAPIMRVLIGMKVHELKSGPLPNATLAPNGKVRETRGSLVEFVASLIKRRKFREFTTNQISDETLKAGWKKRNAANYALNTLKAQGVLRRKRRGKSNNPALWTVV